MAQINDRRLRMHDVVVAAKKSTTEFATLDKLALTFEDKAMDHYGEVHICGRLMDMTVSQEDYTDMPENLIDSDYEIIRKDLIKQGYGIYSCTLEEIPVILLVNCFNRRDKHFAQMAICHVEDGISTMVFQDAAKHPEVYPFGMSSVWRKCRNLNRP